MRKSTRRYSVCGGFILRYPSANGNGGHGGPSPECFLFLPDSRQQAAMQRILSSVSRTVLPRTRALSNTTAARAEAGHAHHDDHHGKVQIAGKWIKTEYVRAGGHRWSAGEISGLPGSAGGNSVVSVFVVFLGGAKDRGRGRGVTCVWACRWRFGSGGGIGGGRRVDLMAKPNGA